MFVVCWCCVCRVVFVLGGVLKVVSLLLVSLLVLLLVLVCVCVV